MATPGLLASLAETIFVAAVVKLEPYSRRESYFPLGDLTVNPGVSLLHPLAKGDGWLPFEFFQDQRVVAVTAADTFGCVEIVSPPELHLRDDLSDVDEPVDGDHLAATQVDR